MKLIKRMEGYVEEKLCVKWEIFENSEGQYEVLITNFRPQTRKIERVDLDGAEWSYFNEIREFLSIENASKITIKGKNNE